MQSHLESKKCFAITRAKNRFDLMHYLVTNLAVLEISNMPVPAAINAD